MDLEIVISNEASQTEKDKYHVTLLICGIEKKNGENELIYKWNRVTDVENNLIAIKGEEEEG